MDRVAFENWAPKASRAWRLNQYPSESQRQNRIDNEEQFAASLEERVRRLSQDGGAVSPTRLGGSDDAAGSPAGASFTDTDDSDINAALAGRLSALSASGSLDESLVAATAGISPADLDAPLSGPELVSLVQAKYGKKYDLTIARRSFAGKDFVSLNVMWVHSEQRSFPMSPEDFADKMEGICLYLNAWNRQLMVRTFMKQKPKGSTLGLPPRPIVGVAVPLQLELEQSVIEEWLGDRLG